METRSNELKTAIKAAQAAGAITLEKFGELSQSEIKGKDYKDFVTEVDKACEAAISSIITERFPDDSMLCEEGTVVKGSSGRTWIVDPLDGTLNFIHSFPVFSISIGLKDSNNELCTGVVFQPVLQELFTAERGCGAYLNGKRISVSNRLEKESFLIATGIPFTEYHYIDSYFGVTKEIIHDCAGTFFSSSLKIFSASFAFSLPMVKNSTFRAWLMTWRVRVSRFPGGLARGSLTATTHRFFS